MRYGCRCGWVSVWVVVCGGGGGGVGEVWGGVCVGEAMDNLLVICAPPAPHICLPFPHHTCATHLLPRSHDPPLLTPLS